MEQALTFDDVLLKPSKGILKTRRDADTSTKITRNLKINAPIISANMDTVTEWRMAVAIAREGGIGIIHRFMSIEEEAQQIKKVKRAQNIIIENPYVLSVNDRVGDMLKKMDRYGVKGFPVLEGRKLVGIVTRRDIRFEEDNEKSIKEVMTPEKDLIYIEKKKGEEVDIEHAKELLKKGRVDKLPIVDEEKNLIGLITAKDLLNLKDKKASRDKKGRLLVGAAVGVKDHIERAGRLIEAGVDVIVVDIAHGHSIMAINAVKELKKEYDVEIIAGNVATKEGTEDLISAGADSVKVGVGPGAACTTRIVTGHGVPQITAIMESYEVAKEYKIPIIADGGMRNSGDLVKAIAAGASAGMFGSLFAGTDESPGAMIIRKGRKYKVYRGMASSAANLDKNIKEGKFKGEDFTSYTAEGVEGIIEHKGSVKEVMNQMIYGLKSGISYAGKRSVEELIGNGKFIKITTASWKESNPHDFNVI